MAELRHSSSLGSRASNSPMKRDAAAVAAAGDSSPLIPDSHLADDDEHDRHSSKERDRHVCSFFNDDPRVSPQHSRISLFFTFLLLLVGLVSVFTIFHKLVSPLSPRFKIR